jgi:hypothetical protein
MMSLKACGINPFDNEKWQEIIRIALLTVLDMESAGSIIARCFVLFTTLGPAGVIDCIIEILTELGLDHLITPFINAFVDAIFGIIEWGKIIANITCICTEIDECLIINKGVDNFDEACCQVESFKHAFSPGEAGKWFDDIVETCKEY